MPQHHELDEAQQLQIANDILNECANEIEEGEDILQNEVGDAANFLCNTGRMPHREARLINRQWDLIQNARREMYAAITAGLDRTPSAGVWTDFSEAQAIQLHLIRMQNFNDCNGEKVAESLYANRELWKAAMMTRLPGHSHGALIQLRDLHRSWSVDTLYITAKPGRSDELFAMAETWNADEVGWHDAVAAGRLLGVQPLDEPHADKYLLRVWWT